MANHASCNTMIALETGQTSSQRSLREQQLWGCIVFSIMKQRLSCLSNWNYTTEIFKKLADKKSICSSLPLTSTLSCDERRLLWFAIFKTRNGNGEWNYNRIGESRPGNFSDNFLLKKKRREVSSLLTHSWLHSDQVEYWGRQGAL